MARPYKLTEQQRIDICNKYQNGFSTTELSEMYSIAVASIRKLLKKNDIPIRSRSESRKQKRFLEKISGENAWNWKGGTVKLKNKIRKLPEYATWITLCYNCHLETETWGFNFEHHKRSVEQIDDKGKVIHKFASIIDASDELNVHKSSINRVCTGEYKTANGLKFRYA